MIDARVPEQYDFAEQIYTPEDGANMMKTAVGFISLALCALYAITPLLINSGFFSGSWDLSIHLYNAFQVSEGIKDGSLYPRWLSLSNGGYGSPVTIFYSPLFYILTGVVNFIIPSLIISLKVVTLIGFLLSGISMYVLLRNFCGRLGSLVGGIVYQLLPYHLFDLYLRESLVETFAFFWLPMILHFAYKGARENRTSLWVGMAFSYAGLVLTHIASAYLFSFVIAAYALFLAIMKKNYRILLRSLLASLVGLSLSAVYFLPMFFERKFVHIGWLKEGHGMYTHNFLHLKENSLDPFYIQLERIVMLLVLLVILSLMLIYYKKKHGEFANRNLFLFFGMVFVFSLFISTSLSMPLWELIPGLPTTQFPWRWLMISTLATAALVGISFDTLSLADIKEDRTTRVTSALFLAILFINIYLSSVYLTAKEPMQQRDLDRIYSEGEDLIEYRPIWLVDEKRSFSEERERLLLYIRKGMEPLKSWTGCPNPD